MVVVLKKELLLQAAVQLAVPFCWGDAVKVALQMVCTLVPKGGQVAVTPRP